MIENSVIISDADEKSTNGDQVSDNNSTNLNRDNSNSSVREINISKLANGSCGFHLSRSKWDPYPWVSRVDKGSTADIAGLKAGDCVLEVNGEDILGLRIADVANLVKSKTENVILLLWATKVEILCHSDSLCCGPMPQNLERLSACVQTLLNALECPICLDTIPPPAIQCINGHLVCIKCKVRSDKCAICRQRYSAGRSLIAEQAYNAIRDSFRHKEDDGKLKDKLFGIHCRKLADNAKIVQSHTHKFLARIMGKASSLDNLTKKDLNDEKSKQISLSVNDIFRTNCSAPSSRSTSPHRLTPEPGAQTYFGHRRPPSINTSVESLSTDCINDNHHHHHPYHHQTKDNLYLCPYGTNCNFKVRGYELNFHIGRIHKVPIISFGSTTASFSLPPKIPVNDCCIQLSFNSHTFWLRLFSTETEYFLATLLQDTEELSESYLIEAKITNNPGTKADCKEIVTRSIVHSLEVKSSMDLFINRTGIIIKYETLSATFGENVEITVDLLIKKINA